ncbi:MAG: S41 family peptidase [Candidatus Nanopelagicales bacterium]|nr:S41 family peptidase [Candidatus Nanopelagicales bacterium]
MRARRTELNTTAAREAGQRRAAPRGIRSGALAVAVATALALSTLLTPSNASPQMPSAAAYTPPAPEDFSALTWTQAFRALNKKMSREYAFTKWKRIKWHSLYEKYAPRIARAEATDNRQAYYLTLRRYLHKLRDGHVSIKPNVEAFEEALVGGGFGLTVTTLDTGAVVATWVKRGGPADMAGIERGARIRKWGGKPVLKALRKTPTVFGPSQPTTARKRSEQLRFLVRAPIGVRRTVVYENRRATARERVKLRAVDDGMETLERTDGSSVLAKGQWPKRMVEHKILPGDVGYVRIYAEIDLPAQLPGDHTPTVKLFRRAIRDFVNAKVAGVIVDVRSNSGGSDQMVADFMASFYSRRAFYEYQNYIVPATRKFQIWIADDVTGEFRSRGKGVWIKPAKKRYQGPVVALVDNACVSSCEGVAMGIQNLPRGRVVGFYGTNGSFGMTGDAAVMPGGLEIDWPYGQSLDKRKVVQIDTRNGKGGILPDQPIPMTLKNALRSAAGHDVVLRRGLGALRRM